MLGAGSWFGDGDGGGEELGMVPSRGDKRVGQMERIISGKSTLIELERFQV